MVVVRLSWSDWNEEVLRSQVLTLVYFWHKSTELKNISSKWSFPEYPKNITIKILNGED
jgi:hypothetical protein